MKYVKLYEEFPQEDAQSVMLNPGNPRIELFEEHNKIEAGQIFEVTGELHGISADGHSEHVFTKGDLLNVSRLVRIHPEIESKNDRVFAVNYIRQDEISWLFNLHEFIANTKLGWRRNSDSVSNGTRRSDYVHPLRAEAENAKKINH